MSIPNCLYEEATEEDRKECKLLKDPYADFCDRCGKEIFRCVNPKCPVYGVPIISANGKRCGKCGKPVEPNGPPAGESPPGSAAAPQQTPAVQVQASPPPHATEFMAAPGSRLSFHHSNGWQIELADGDILGRVNGRFADRLGSAKFVSGTHAKITRGADGWYIADQGSKNKTWVNGKEVPQNTPLRIKQNDIVTLADQKFTITEL